jgi:hypothetical protein
MAERAHPQIIRLELREVSQLFNSMDPSPFIERDLDGDAEEFIVGWARELPTNVPITLRIYLRDWPEADPKELISQAVHNYFAHRAQITHLEFRRLMREGRTSFSIGAIFLAACLVIIRTLLADRTGASAGILRESLTIAGWVAMWRPMQIYLYDWWPLRQTGRIFTKLSRMPVEVTQHRKDDVRAATGIDPKRVTKPRRVH